VETNQKTQTMKKQRKLNYATLSFAADDLKLIDEAVCKLHSTTKCDNKKDELARISWLLSQVINPEIYKYSDSSLMNS
jgi:hypothetical protein